MPVNLYQRRKGGYFYYDFITPEGKRVQRSTKTKDKTVAKERARQAELDATPNARGRKQKLSDAIDHMIKTLHDKADGTIEMYEQKGRRIGWTKPDPYVHEVTHDWLADYIAKRLDKSDKKHGCAAGHTVQKELITIRKALKLCVKRGILAQMPSFPEFSPAYKPRSTWLTPEQFSLVCNELDANRRLWASLAALAGANLSEVESIEWPMVDLTRGRMLIPGTKRETRRRTVPIAPALRHLLEQVDAKARRGKLVQSWSNVRRDLHAAVHRANRKLLEDAMANGQPVPDKIPLVSPNDLRRTFASWLIQNGADRFTVAVLMGHSSTRMIEKVYGKLRQENLDTAIAVMPQLPGWSE